MDEKASAPVFLHFADDLMWTSRVAATGQGHGIAVKTARTLDRLEALTREHSPRCVILDLGLAGASATDAVTRVRAASPTPVRIVGYGSHVDVATLQAARAAGCDPALPRSQMASELERLMEEWKS